VSPNDVGQSTGGSKKKKLRLGLNVVLYYGLSMSFNVVYFMFEYFKSWAL